MEDRWATGGADRDHPLEDLWTQDPVLSRAEHRRLRREREHTAPARARLRAAAVLAVVVVLAVWLLVSRIGTGSAPSEEFSETASVEGGADEARDDSEDAGGVRPSETPPSEESTDEGPEPSEGEPAGEPEQESALVVHVAGAVESPGIVELQPEARVHEAIEAAGGVTSEAAPEGLNLAAPAEDGSLIHVPTSEELDEGVGPPSADGGGEQDGGSGPDAGPETAESAVDVNTADSETLQNLPGVGPAMAERIIDHRESEGPFAALEDLAAVSGIGPARLQELDGRVTW
ncbi:MAG: ComEA family DNA-binding protein [Nesterenkonia sp.]|uniref:ComEA family DNA-binding protein n=1 Tax=Nesterenkonia marinintestina TaxID=2979865 RepID=UPI0021C057EF|nr:ComEA family DNA-binding protein [Nesterenkonia sp. GX14115]MDO5493612.1 ComEA family DNA-binding protein [Nesterenkonia sp.]